MYYCSYVLFVISWNGNELKIITDSPLAHMQYYKMPKNNNYKKKHSENDNFDPQPILGVRLAERSVLLKQRDRSRGIKKHRRLGFSPFQPNSDSKNFMINPSSFPFYLSSHVLHFFCLCKAVVLSLLAQFRRAVKRGLFGTIFINFWNNHW